MTEEREWIDQIRAAPDDDGPRLVFADWLMQRGDPRGEFIAAQCTIERLEREGPDDAAEEVRRLRRRAGAIFKQHQAMWLAPLRAVLGAHYVHHRGLVEELRWTMNWECLAAVPRLLAQAPLLRRIVVEMSDLVSVEELAESGHPWHSFSLRDAVADQEVAEAMVNLPLPLAELSFGLDGRHSRIDRARLFDALAACPARAGLRVLRLVQMRQLGGLRAHLTLPRLEELEIGNGDLRAADLVAITAARPELVVLDVHYNRDAKMARELDAGELLAPARGLRRLRLNAIGIGDAQAIAIARAPAAAGLRWLDLGQNRIGDAGARAFAESERSRGLWRLNLSANPISKEGKRLLRESPHLARAELVLR
jgi:uncharacterized protein (TIGR02996 family)